MSSRSSAIFTPPTAASSSAGAGPGGTSTTPASALECGAGGFYLGQHVRGLNRSFQDGVHCGYFDGLPDMERKIAWWLAHPAEREACRQRGFALVQREHTYTNRAELLLYALRSRGFLV